MSGRNAASVVEVAQASPPPEDASWSATGLRAIGTGPVLAWELWAGDAEASSDDALVEAVVAFRRMASWAEAGAARVAALLAERESMNPGWPAAAGGVGVLDVTADELAPALACSRRSARRLVADGKAWTGVLTATGEALAAGAIDVPRARVMAEALAECPPEQAWAVEDAVLPGAATRTAAQLSRDVAKALLTVDPGGAADRARGAVDRRRLDRPRPLPDGLAGVYAVLPAAEAARLDSAVDLLARGGRAAGDPRTMDQLRADVLVDLVLGRTVHGGGDAAHEAAGAAAQTGRRPSVRSRINVTVPLDVLAGFSEGPGFLEGYGPIPASVARELATDATWRRILTDPASGAVLDVGRTAYRPPASLVEHVRARDRWCARPGCSARAESCDLDHTREWERDGGETAHDNLGPLCRRDHQLKTHGGFRLTQLAPGEFEWVSPLGRRYRVTPGRDGPYLRLSGGEGVPRRAWDSDGGPEDDDLGPPPEIADADPGPPF